MLVFETAISETVVSKIVLTYVRGKMAFVISGFIGIN